MSKYDSMFDAIQNNNYQTTKKKKKSYEEQFDDIQNNSYEMIAPIKSNQQQEEEKFSIGNEILKRLPGYSQYYYGKKAIEKIKGINPEDIVNTTPFDDGYQPWDVTKTAAGTILNGATAFTKGVMGIGDSAAKLVAGGAAQVFDWAGNEEFANALRKAISDKSPEAVANKRKYTPYGWVEQLNENTDDYSILGEAPQQALEGAGYYAGMTALQEVGVPWYLTAATSSMGNELGEAYSHDAEDWEAWASAINSAAWEVVSEKLAGGVKLPGTGKTTEALFGSAVDQIKNKTLKALVGFGINMAGEGAEEVLSGITSEMGRRLTYMRDDEKSLIENALNGATDYMSQQALDDFIMGAVVSGLTMGVNPQTYRNAKAGRNLVTGYTSNEQRVLDKVTDDRIAEAQKNSKKPLTKKQLNQISSEVKADFESGNIGTKNIENVLGYGEVYLQLKNQTEDSIGRELTPEEDRAVLQEATEIYNESIKDDAIIQQNYYEDSLRSQVFEANLEDYDEELRETIQKAIDSGILNNSTKTHQFVEFLSNLARDKGVTFDFTNNEALANSGIGINGAQVNGYVNANGDITLNIESGKSLNSVVGHELTHVLEGSDLYKALSDSIKEYATTIGEYQDRYDKLAELYKDVKNANIEKELTADLVGDYLFTNQEFINHLTQNRNLFQRIYDEIKYLVKQATAGSKEQRQLNKAMKMFEKAYKDNSVKLAEKEASTQPKYSITQDSNGKELSKKQQEYFKDSKAVDENGNLITVYHTTTEPSIQFNEFNPVSTPGYRFDNQVVNFYTNSKTMSGSYADYDYEMADTKKLNSIEDVKKWIDKQEKYNFKEGTDKFGQPYYAIEENGNNILSYTSKEKMLKNIKSDLQKEKFDNVTNIQYEGYVNITNPYIVDAEEMNWDEIVDSYDEMSVRYANEIKEEDKQALIDLVEDSKERYKEINNRLEQIKNEVYDGRNEKYHTIRGIEGIDSFREDVLRQLKGKYKEKISRLLDEYENLRNTPHFEDDYFRANVSELQDKINDYLNMEYSDFDLYKMADSNFDKTALKHIFGQKSSTNDIVKKVLNQNKNGANYDGVIIKNVLDYGSTSEFDDLGAAQDVYVTFNSNQFKAVDNENPTEDADIRYSLSSTGEMVDNTTGEKVELDLSNTGNTGTLMAIHNLNEDKLNGVLDLGGFPVPSIAVTNPDIINHSSFGNISVLFDKETINPANKKNEIYDRDVWSPTFPTVEYEVNGKEVENIEKELGIDNKNYQNTDSIQHKALLSLYNDHLEQKLNSGNIEYLQESMKNNRDMQYAYMKSKGLIEPVYKEQKYNNNVPNDILQQFLEQYQGSTDFSWNTPLNELDYNQTMELSEAIKRIVRPYFEENNADSEMVDKLVNRYNNFNELTNFINSAYKMNKYGANATEIDEYATLDKVKEELNKEEYDKWVEDTFNENIINDKGFRNDADIFTPSGNRRSFKATHYPVNLENIVKIMSKKDTKAGQDLSIFGTGFGRISAKTSQQFKSINDIKQNENRLMTDEQANELIQPMSDKLLNDITELSKYYNKSDYKSDIVTQMQASDTTGELVEEFAGENMTIDNFKKLLNEYGTYDVENIPLDVLNNIIEDLNNISKLPTDYFEAKPQRAVGLDEIQQVVIPSNASQELRDRLQEMGIPFTEYNPEIEGDRNRVINQFDDLKFSMSKQNEDIAPIGNYNVYGSDIALQDEIAPTKQPGLTYGEDIAYQEIAPIRQDLVDLQNDIAAIKEDYRKQSEDIKKELQLLRQEREEIDRGVNEVAPIDEYTPVESDIAPYESETAYPNTNVVPLDDKLLNKYKKYFKENFYFKGKQLDNAMEGIKELSANPELTQEDVYKYFKKNFGKYETQQMNYSINEAKSDLRHMEIGVSDEVKKDIAHRYDGFGNFRKKNFGKMKLVEYNGNNGVDQVYSDLVERFPGTVNPDIINPADQLVALSELANDKGYDTFFSEQPDELIRAYANEMYSMIKDFRNETNQRLAEEQIPLSYLEEIAPVGEEETIDDYYNNLNERITNLETELENIPKREYYDIQSREMDERLSERIEPEKRDILDLINLENAKKNGKKVELVKPVIAKEKSSARTTIDTLKEAIVNENVELDNMAKESGNKMIKIAGDMLNNAYSEAQYDITAAQTDNYGNAIGKSVQQLFEDAKKEGLEAAFNDYLINYSNIDRWARGKGSQTPLDVSERLVANYEEKYPQFKEWAQDVWKFAENVRNNWLEAGMITQNMYKVLSEAYPHYVPYISDTNNFDATMDKMTELKARPIKKAKGGAAELFPVEEALTRYTYSQKKAYRQNELYKQIYNTLQTNPGQRGAEVGEDYFNGTEPNLYRDDSGNYLTAVIDGEERKVQISDDLYKSLSHTLNNQVKDLEDRLSTVLKPLQWASNIRRKLLTTWNPVFLVKNVVKDLQDGVLNSKHTTGMLKNYAPGIVELFTNSTPEAKQFKALYGTDALRGQYEEDLYKPKEGNKNNGFLKGLVNANEIMELAPRYAEFKASLQAGESLEEAMYNAREVTTNFARGGVITKALNRNGFTFLNASVQGFDKFIRNFSGENGARGIANSLLKAAIFAVAPAVFNELAFGAGDDKDEDYDALPDYIKDNYYLIKMGDGTFVRIPKGRMLSVFGSAARRTIELAEGEEDAFEGYLSNVNNQIGVSNPEENNVFSPLIQAFGSENGTSWYGGDIVPTRLQDKPAAEQYDASTDKMSIWLGEHTGISPYKINYVLDQYSGGIGDIALPMITDEATSNGNVLAPVVDQFVVDSTTDNKYVSDFYSKNDELKVKANSSKATDDDLLRNQFSYEISKELGQLYAERREIQSNNSLTKAQKYEKSQAIKKQINEIAKFGLDNTDNISRTGNYADVGDRAYYKNAKGKWTAADQKDITATESMGLTNREKDAYYTVKNEMYNIDQTYDAKLKGASDEQKTKLNAQKKVDIINSIKNTNLPDNAKATLYDKKYGSTETLNAVIDCKIDFDSYLDLQAQNFTADKDINGKTINGSKKRKIYSYINQLDMPYEQKIMLAKLEYKSDDTYNREIINYLNNDKTINYQTMVEILEAMGFKIDSNGNISWE